MNKIATEKYIGYMHAHTSVQISVHSFWKDVQFVQQSLLLIVQQYTHYQ